jgi:hypothetical protein
VFKTAGSLCSTSRKTSLYFSWSVLVLKLAKFLIGKFGKTEFLCLFSAVLYTSCVFSWRLVSYFLCFCFRASHSFLKMCCPLRHASLASALLALETVKLSASAKSLVSRSMLRPLVYGFGRLRARRRVYLLKELRLRIYSCWILSVACT